MKYKQTGLFSLEQEMLEHIQKKRMQWMMAYLKRIPGCIWHNIQYHIGKQSYKVPIKYIVTSAIAEWKAAH